MKYIARDLMNTDVIAVPADLDLRDLAKLFLEKGITGAPVVNGDGELVGVISQTDLIYYNLTRDDELVLDSHFYHIARMEGQHVPTGFQIEDTNTGCVADVMTPLVHSVTERASVESIVRMMTSKHIHRVIVRKGKRVSGIISALDVLRVAGPKHKARSTKARSTKARPTKARPTKTAGGRRKVAGARG